MKKASDNPQPTVQAELFEFNLMQLANYLFSHRWFIAIGTAACVFIAGVWITLIRQPVYRATVTINIDLMAEEKSGAMGGGAAFWMQEQMVANKVGITEQYFESQEFRHFLVKILTDPGPPDELRADIEIIKGEMEKRGVTDDREEMGDWIQSKLDLRGLNERSRLELTGSANKPIIAASLANLGAYSLIEYNRLMLVQRLKSLKTFLNTQTMLAKQELRGLEDELVALQKRARIISPDEVRAKVNALQVDQEARLIEFDRQYTSLNSLILETEADLEYFKKLMQENRPASHIYVEQIQRRLEVLRYEKIKNAETKANGKPGARGMADATGAAIDKGIDDVATELSKQLETLGPVSQSPWEYVKKIETALFELKQKRAQAKSEMQAQQAAVQRTTKEFIGLPEVLKHMSEVKRTIDLTTGLYTALMTRLQDTQIKEAAHANDLVMVSSAEAPAIPSGLGRMKTVMLSFIGGIILSALPLLLRFVLLPTIRNAKDLRHMNVPIIGSVGWYRGGQSGPALSLRLQNQATRLLKDAASSPEANALRFVRFQIEQTLAIRAFQAGQASRLVMVSSVNPGEGRTFTAANLADLFAASGVRTCIIDLDFHKPSICKFFPDAVVESSPMTELFPEACGFQMLKVSDKLTVLRPTPKSETMSEAIDTREFEAALNALEVIFELIIIDTPPLTGHMEPVVAAQYADAFLLVINQRRTLRTEVEESIRTLQSALKIPIFGMMNFTFDEVSQVRRKQKPFSLTLQRLYVRVKERIAKYRGGRGPGPGAPGGPATSHDRAA